MRAPAVVMLVALAGCHVVERNEILRPGATQRVRLADAKPRGATIALTETGRFRFVEPLECKTEEIVAQVAGTEVVTKPNLATFVVGIIATAVGGIATVRGLSDSDPAGSPFTYAGIGLVGAGLPFAIGPWVGNRVELVPGAERPALRRPGPSEPCGERAIAGKTAMLRVRGVEIAGRIDAEGMFSVSPYALVDAYGTTAPNWEIEATIDDKQKITATIAGPAFVQHAKGFLAKAPFEARIEPMRLVPGVVPGAMRLSLTTTVDGPAIRVVVPLKNDGPGPAWAMRGQLVAPSIPAIDGRILYAGHLPKGDVREHEMMIPISNTAATALRNEQVDVSLELRDAHGTAPTTPVRFRSMILVDAPR
jgi:hypothetical protein